MNKIKKTILTLVALLAVTTGAWAADTYTITFAANGNTKSVENVTLPKTFQCSYDNADGELDLILKELYSWSGDKNKTCCDGETTPNSSDENKVVAGNDNGDHYITINNVFEGTVTITGYYVVNSLVIETPYSLEISFADPATTVDDVAWDKAKKTGTFKMPGGNVTLEPEYYPQAALTAAPTAINDVPATTDGAIVNAGTVANIGSTETAQGTVMYYVSQTALDDAALLALATDQWTADVPTAESLAQGQAYVYYYVRGNDSDTDEENFSDGDIKAANALTVTIAAEPTYAVTFAEGTEESDKWSASPNADVKKGQQVTVTYTGSKKIIGVKAEKKAATTSTQLSAVTTSDIGKVVCAAGHLHDAKTAVPDGCTAVGILGKVTETGHGLILALEDATSQDWNTINGWTSETTYAGTTLKVLPDDAARGTNLTSYTTLGTTAVSNWAVAQKSDYEAIFINLGSTKSDNDGTTYDGNVNDYINTGVGGTAISGDYWSATESGVGYAWRFESEYWSSSDKTNSRSVRPVLGF